MSQIIASPGPTIHHNGKVWRLGFNDQNAKGRLEELIRSHVIRDALQTKRELGGKDGEESYEFTDNKVKKGYYHTFAKGWNEILNSSVGAVLYMLSLLQKHHPDATEDDARTLLINEPEQSEAAIVAISPDFLETVAIQMGVSPEKATLAAITIVNDLKGINVAKNETPEPVSATAS